MKIPTNTMQLFDEMSSYGETHTANGNYYSEPDDSSNPVLDGDFSEYMWMENEEQFDRQVLAELEEEELIEQCMEAMLEDELLAQSTAAHQLNQNGQNSNNDTDHLINGTTGTSTNSNEDGQDIRGLCEALDKVSTNNFGSADKSTLNPLAAEFVPATRVTGNVSSPV